MGRSDRQVKIRGFRIELGEIEVALKQHPSVKQAVVTIPEDEKGKQRLVAYMVLGSHTTDNLQEFVRTRLPQYMVPHRFVTLKTIPLTGNGKIDYKALPAPKEESNYVAPNTPQEETLATIWAEILGLDRISVEDNFFQLGGDSILSIQVISKANEMGLQLTPQQLFEYPTIVQLAAVAKTIESIQTETGIVTGKVPLTPIQQWFFAQEFSNPNQCHQSMLLEVQQELDYDILQQVIKQLLEHHDALRLRFQATEQGWQQINVPPDEIVPISRIDLSGELATKQTEKIASIEAELKASLNLSNGPLIKVAYFELGKDKQDQLLIIIHHLVVDSTSWKILLEDIQVAYQQLIQGEKEVNLPTKTTSFKQWAEKLNQFVDSSDPLLELEYWQSQTPKPIIDSSTDFPFSPEQKVNKFGSATTISVSLNQKETEDLLQEVPKAYNTQINDVLLTALVQSYCQWTNNNSLYIALEGNGRENLFSDIDLSRTVGLFTTEFPILLSLKDSSSLGESLKTIKEQLRKIPNNSESYGILKYINQNSPFETTPQPQLKFNYLGQFDQVFQDTSIFQTTSRNRNLNRSQQGNSSYLLEIDGLVSNGEIQFNWTYSREIYDSNTIESLADNFIEALRNLITHCQDIEVGSYTPSDFPEAEVSQTELDQLFAKISQMDA
ncbi:condensation domain-containing protein [Crocosphaera sp. Alani8]|uniref:condensation domain-containing protein n=1 Tax=Crocosphaera sp. Alani8 TaxID=3038952 RepID=UPI00313CD447